MHPPTRSQADPRTQQHDLATRLDCSTMPDLARQEFKDDADTNLLLKRFGVGVPQKQTQFGGTMDFNLDLQTAKIGVAASRQAYLSAPQYVRERYPTWDDFVLALNTKTLDLTQPPPIVNHTPPPTEA